MTSFLLQQAGHTDAARPGASNRWRRRGAWCARRRAPERPLVLKPLFGSQGRGLRLIDSVAALPPADEVARGLLSPAIRSAARAPGWRDWRVFVVGGRRRRRHDPPRHPLAHERQPGSTLRRRAGRGRTGETGQGGGRGRGRRLCRRRHRAGCGRPLSRWRSTACRPGPPLHASPRSTSRTSWPRAWWRSCGRRRRSPVSAGRPTGADARGRRCRCRLSRRLPRRSLPL